MNYSEKFFGMDFCKKLYAILVCFFAPKWKAKGGMHMESRGVGNDNRFSPEQREGSYVTNGRPRTTVIRGNSTVPSQQERSRVESHPAQRHSPTKQVYRAKESSPKTSSVEKPQGEQARPYRPPRRRRSPPEPDAPKAQEKKKLWRKLVSDVLFFAVLLGVVLGAGIYRQTYRQGSSILGHYFFSVLTTSMQGEIPKGSLVIVKTTPAHELQIGDDITFYRDPQTVITHRIVGIEENYENSGGRAFVTKGTENPMEDQDPVHEANVVGKVIKTLPGFGFAVSLIGANLKWIVLLLALLFVLVTSLRIFLSGTGKPEKTKRPECT